MKEKISKGKKNVKRYENRKNFNNCIEPKVKKTVITEKVDLKLPGTPYIAEGNKEERLSKLPFSEERKLLFKPTKTKKERLIKALAFQKEHDEKIKKIISNKKINEFDKLKELRKKMQFVLTVNRVDSKGNPYVFSTNYSNKPLKMLKVIAENLNTELSKKWKDYSSIGVYKKENLRSGMKANPAEFYFYSYNVKTNAA